MKNRLEELRKERGIKQEDLAVALEVSRQTIMEDTTRQFCSHSKYLGFSV